MRFLLAALLLTIAWSAPAQAAGPLPPLRLQPGSLTVSGISAGGYMALQYEVAYSASVAGAAILAAGPWDCAQGSVTRALGPCMKGDPPPQAADTVAALREAARREAIDPPEGLAADRAWVFRGTHDAYVGRAVTDALVEFYRAFLPEANLRYVTSVPAAHGFPTEDEGIGCDMTGEPWLNDCDYDAAGELLRHLYGPLKPAVRAVDAHLHAFGQARYAPGGELGSMEATGYLYVPAACERGASCRVHVAFHGCRQGSSFVGKAFVRNAGYNGWAESNDIVVLYPQVGRSLVMPFNPQGCWDWWGYTGAGYATREGPQLVAVRRMLEALGLPE